MTGTISVGEKSYDWAGKGNRFVCSSLCHPGGMPIRFRSTDAMTRHVQNMRGKALTHTHKARRSAQKSRRNRSK